MGNAAECGVHLVGSVPLEDSRRVFTVVSEKLGRLLKRIPDGETGPRSNWIAWQLKVFEQVPQLESEMVTTGYIQRPKFRLRAGANATDVRFPALGYSAAARASYAEFRALRDAGTIPAGTRFQVALPTPLAPLHSYVFPESQAALEAPYEARLLAELDEIVAAIPAQDLAIQWDTAIEFAILEGVMPTFYAHPEQDIVERLVRWGNRMPRDVELGFHLCYGDSGHKHFKEPDDAALLVRVANALAAGLARPLNWLHLPVPRARTDAAYYAPLAGLRLHPETELYLGLVHRTDGEAGTRARMAAARTVVPRFGIATECGLGRRKPDDIPVLLELHKSIATAA
jgi:hypothetical protein